MADLDPAPVLDAVARDPRLRTFLGQGKIETIPARQSRRRLLLDTIAQAFEPGVSYSERRVSLFLAAVHDDYAALRRYLVDGDFLSRAEGQYWRSSGTVLPSPTPDSGVHADIHPVPVTARRQVLSQGHGMVRGPVARARSASRAVAWPTPVSS
jgi:hypothetical protein